MGTTTTRTGPATLAIAVVITVGGCAADGGDHAAVEPTADRADAVGRIEESTADPPADDADDADDAAERPAASTGAAGDAEAVDLGLIGRDVVVEMDVAVASDDIARSVVALGDTARRLGGGVTSAEVDHGSDDPRDGGDDGGVAVVVVAVPPDSVDELLAGLDAIGTVESLDQRTQDVTGQLVDLDVRIDNARASVVNVRAFMDRAEDLADLVTLEGELIRRQTELERLEARRRDLDDRVALATVTVRIVPAASPPVDVVTDRSIGDAFRDGWGAFASVATTIAVAVAAALPFLAVIALAAGAWFGHRRRRARRAAAAPTTDRTTTDRTTTGQGSATGAPPADPTGDRDLDDVSATPTG